MAKPLTKPPLYRLTLSQAAVMALPRVVKLRGLPACERRADGKIDVWISISLMDQIQTAALAKENLSDTLIRIEKAKL